MPRRSAGSGTAAPVRSTCTPYCRCRGRYWNSARTDPASRAWLAAHWGTDGLRHVEQRPGRPRRRLPAGHAVIGYGFFTEGETPQAAMSALASSWPELRFLLRPVPSD